ncbi:glycoside hydrolase family 88 protein [Saprospiraceae bacterium]|nr:glycoside hydrolase family 88 protein [Saprospiraceae bacterium]
MKCFIYFLVIVAFNACQFSDSSNVASEQNITSSKVQLEKLTARAVKDLSVISFDSTAIPRTLKADGQLKGTKSKSWTSGFYPGLLWQLYDYSKNDELKQSAIQWTAVVEKEKLDSSTHDLGFKIYCPFGNAYKITKDKKYSDVFFTAARTLSSRYNPKIGAIRSWDFNKDVWKFPVIIDNMMNLEMMFEATTVSGDSSFYYIAEQHAKTTLKNHFRPDNSSYHVVSYDPDTGEVEKKNTHQGYSHESAWSRGQAWGLYGFATTYRYTKNPEFLDQAIKIANYIFSHPNLPQDLIPYWDYNAPNIPEEPRDVSAATITASGLYELSKHDPKNAKKYIDWADTILESLDSKKYQCDTAPFLLKHSVGSIPGEFEVDAPIIYADYYYVEALLRQSKLQG